ncbi:MAG: UDP-N-acetylglucosamine diphosphorylase [Oscillospiraceae bacterium]|jgi:bifunctional UDP-N-acetylglucosamine pyrophosphorylase/glucosamine-1-phosphate N-acetyltransferase|nr:UDP-N-acetylglucosamine diphosphorylase [Oscillospiraceae bacterium]
MACPCSGGASKSSTPNPFKDYIPKHYTGATPRQDVTARYAPTDYEQWNTGYDRMRAAEQLRLARLYKRVEAGVVIPCPDAVVIDDTVEIETGATIYPGTVLRGNTHIGKACIIGPNTTLDNVTVGDHCSLNNVVAEYAVVEDHCTVGPFVRLRSGAVISSKAKVGNFVEIKNSTIGECSKVAHLSYIGDTDMGGGCNVGCGFATANFDGFEKHRTTIGDGVFIGCDNTFVAPVTIGDGAYTAAGSTITEDVPAGALAFGRARQVNLEGRAPTGASTDQQLAD